MPLFYFDPVTGSNRLKRRYTWGLSGFALGVGVGVLLTMVVV
ncbi:hypothetical protein [Sinimarinibacterium sp. CAU 1509]|nr:hypothetical protein [Sinimarinibacterium sp. CAU 1509]